MSNTIFRLFNPKAKQDPVEKRRAQLRRAQQTYRDRKDKYTKSLEHELARCRASEASLMYDGQCLRDTVNALLGLLSQHGIEPPASPWSDCGQGKAHLAQSSLLMEASESPGQKENLESLENQETWFSTKEFSGTSARPEFQQSLTDQPPVAINGSMQYGALFSTSKGIPKQTTLPPESNCQKICDTDATTVGMEFVLAIETPCLGHIHANPKKPLEPHGHALTTTAQLQYASSALTPGSPRPQNGLLHDVPATMLNRLLDLSPALCSEGEVTPVQAWNHIRSQPNFSRFEIGYLRKLADKLRDAATCHGFGAVVEQTVFQNLVGNILGSRLAI